MANRLLQSNRSDRALKWLLPGLIMLAGLAVTLILVGYEQQAEAKAQRDLAVESLSRLSANLEQAMHERLSITTALGAFVQTHRGDKLETPQQLRHFEENFRQFTRFLDNRSPGIISMQLAPQGVVTYVTNEARNRSAIGHDLLIDDARRQQVLEAINQRSLIVAGPLHLIQGGEAIIARQALFTRPGAFPPERYLRLRRELPSSFDIRQVPDDFWGLATVLIDIPTLYRSAGLQEVAERYPLAIRGRHGLGADGEVFWGEPSIFDDPTAHVVVNFPGGVWIIAVKLNPPPLSGTTLLLMFTGVLGSAAIAYAVASRDARNRAQAQSRAKSAFLSTMSHELRTPMNAIMGFAQILQYDDTLDAEQRESVQEILMAGDHLLTLINEVLDLAKIEAGGLELSLEPIDVAVLCEDCRRLAAPMAKQRVIKLNLSVPQDLFVEADSVRLKQVVLNLLSNAIKYNREGGEVNLIASRQGDQVRIQVEDSGRGIKKADLARLFEPFCRIDEEAGTSQGTGIGLTITQSLVSLMKGSLGLESAPGVGSRFWVDLPLATVVSRQVAASGGTHRGFHGPAMERATENVNFNKKGESDER